MRSPEECEQDRLNVQQSAAGPQEAATERSPGGSEPAARGVRSPGSGADVRMNGSSSSREQRQPPQPPKRTNGNDDVCDSIPLRVDNANGSLTVANSQGLAYLCNRHLERNRAYSSTLARGRPACGQCRVCFYSRIMLTPHPPKVLAGIPSCVFVVGLHAFSVFSSRVYCGSGPHITEVLSQKKSKMSPAPIM